MPDCLKKSLKVLVEGHVEKAHPQDPTSTKHIQFVAKCCTIFKPKAHAQYMLVCECFLLAKCLAVLCNNGSLLVDWAHKFDNYTGSTKRIQLAKNSVFVNVRITCMNALCTLLPSLSICRISLSSVSPVSHSFAMLQYQQIRMQLPLLQLPGQALRDSSPPPRILVHSPPSAGLWWAHPLRL